MVEQVAVTQATPVKQGEVMTSIDHLSNSVHRLEKIVDSLLPMLCIVSKPDQPTDSSSEKRESICELSDIVYSFSERVSDIVSRLATRKQGLQL